MATGAAFDAGDLGCKKEFGGDAWAILTGAMKDTMSNLKGLSERASALFDSNTLLPSPAAICSDSMSADSITKRLIDHPCSSMVAILAVKVVSMVSFIDKVMLACPSLEIDDGPLRASRAKFTQVEIRLRSYLAACQATSVLVIALPDLADKPLADRTAKLAQLTAALSKSANKGKLQLPVQVLDLYKSSCATLGSTSCELTPIQAEFQPEVL